jgi:hypothetical protein
MSTRDDGGPAFPIERMAAHGMTLRDYFIAHAPAQEIADMCPSTARGCEQLLGLGELSYSAEEHYFDVLAVLRCRWADAMLKARQA